jgi:hypothetical protein
MLPDYTLGEPAVLAFVLIPVLLAGLLAAGAAAAWRRAGAPRRTARRVAVATLAASAAWMALTWAAARSGRLADMERTPPPFALLVVAILGLAAAIAFSRFGDRLVRLPLWMLVAVQAFRLPLEIAMHQMYERGIMPVQMSYSGRNFDILTGLSAVVVAALVWSGRAGRGVVSVWNAAGFALLANVVLVAILSTPRIGYYGPAHLNVFVLHAPFVWLPAVMVLAALAGHLLIFRALAAGERAAVSAPPWQPPGPPPAGA